MKKSKQERKVSRTGTEASVGLENVPVEKYEGIDLVPVWDFVSQFLLNSRSDKNFLEAALKSWLENQGFLDRLSDFYAPNVEVTQLKPVAAQFLSMQFLRVFRDQILPDFFPNGKHSLEYKTAKRTCSRLISQSKRGWGKQMVFTPQVKN